MTAPNVGMLDLTLAFARFCISAGEDAHLAAKMIQANLHSFAVRARAGESFKSLLAQAHYFVDKVCG